MRERSRGTRSHDHAPTRVTPSIRPNRLNSKAAVTAACWHNSTLKRLERRRDMEPPKKRGRGRSPKPTMPTNTQAQKQQPAQGKQAANTVTKMEIVDDDMEDHQAAKASGAAGRGGTAAAAASAASTKASKALPAGGGAAEGEGGGGGGKGTKAAATEIRRGVGRPRRQSSRYIKHIVA